MNAWQLNGSRVLTMSCNQTVFYYSLIRMLPGQLFRLSPDDTEIIMGVLETCMQYSQGVLL